MHARTLTHCRSHTDTHPHVLTKNCKTDCEKCRMRWVSTIGDAKSILDFVYSMFVCVCVYFVYSVYTRTTLAGAPNYRGLSIETDCRCQLARQYLQAPPCSCSSARAAQQRRQPESERDPNCPSASAAATVRVFGGSTLQLFSQYFLRYLVFCKHIQLA